MIPPVDPYGFMILINMGGNNQPDIGNQSYWEHLIQFPAPTPGKRVHGPSLKLYCAVPVYWSYFSSLSLYTGSIRQLTERTEAYRTFIHILFSCAMPSTIGSNGLMVPQSNCTALFWSLTIAH